MVAITGNTFAVKDQIKALGGRWDATKKCWMVPEAVAAQAKTLVSGTPKSGGGTRSFRGRQTVCKTCGCRINYGVYCGKCEYS